MVIVSVTVSTIEPSFKNESKSLFAGGSDEPEYDLAKARRIRSIESLPFEAAAHPADLADLFPTGGWIDLTGPESHVVLGEIKLPKDGRFRIPNAKHPRRLLVEFKADDRVLASRQVGVSDLIHSSTRRGNLRLNRVVHGEGFPMAVLFHETSVKVQDGIDMSQARATISKVSNPGMWSSHCEKGSVPPPRRLADADAIAFAIAETSVAQLVKLVFP